MYLLVGAECGIPALAALLAWFLWHWGVCIRMGWQLRGTEWQFIPAGLLGGLTAVYLQSTLEWVLRQPRGMFFLVLCFAVIAHIRTNRQPAEVRP